MAFTALAAHLNIIAATPAFAPAYRRASSRTANTSRTAPASPRFLARGVFSAFCYQPKRLIYICCIRVAAPSVAVYDLFAVYSNHMVPPPLQSSCCPSCNSSTTSWGVTGLRPLRHDRRNTTICLFARGTRVSPHLFAALLPIYYHFA